jgi:hypothetical protein
MAVGSLPSRLQARSASSQAHSFKESFQESFSEGGGWGGGGSNAAARSVSMFTHAPHGPRPHMLISGKLSRGNPPSFPPPCSNGHRGKLP